MKNAYWDDSPPFKFPKTGVSAFSLRSHCPDSPFHSSILHGGRKYHGTHCYSQPPFLSLAILLAFSLHTLYRAFEGQSELFTWAFPSSHHCSSWSLYFEKSSFHCSQANNYSSIASFSMQPRDPSHSPLPTSHVSLSYTEGNLYFWSFTKEWWEVKYWISKREKKKSFPKLL